MSATPTRVEWDITTAEAGSPLEQGNRALESIARHEAMGALLAFSGLHEQLQKQHSSIDSASDRDLAETERFILDEVLQLICARAQALTQADGVLVALAEARPAGTEPEAESALLCRAAAGPLAVDRGIPLISESEFLRECLTSGRILRSDDCETDARLEMDFARAIGACSTVLLPLGGQREPHGVLQAYSSRARAFSDQDIRIFDLFAELLLSALRPDDQDRRTHWLSDVADQVLASKPRASSTVIVDAEAIPTRDLAAGPLLAAIPSPATPPLPQAAPASPEVTADAVSDPLPPAQLSTMPADSIAVPQPVFHLPQPAVELPEDGLAEQSFKRPSDRRLENRFENEPTAATVPKLPLVLPHPAHLPLPGSSRPGLSVVLGLVAVAALFSAGAWWGMQAHSQTASARVDAQKIAARVRPAGNARPSPPTIPALPSAPVDGLPPSVSDNLMNPQRLDSGSEDAPLTAVESSKLAALPKVTGLRHWSSSLGSTVVIDMEDQVPYEVHRLVSPERIYFDLHDTVLSPDLDGKTMDVGDASLTRVRIAQPVAGVTRIVLDTKDGSNFSVSMESSPYRLVVELRGSQKTMAANQLAPARAPNQASPSFPTSPKPAPTAVLPAKTYANNNPSDQPLVAKSGKFRIVLDAGHGGWDLGTVGRQGLLEKDLVLDVTQRLGRLLQSRLGSEVMLTRSDDNYLPLDQRADFANHAQADLFVSVHANYSSSAAARGVETYYTNLFSAPGSKEVEKHDDGTFAKLTPVSLSAGGLHEKIEESRRLAACVQRSLYATIAASSPDIRNRGIKDSAFAVLTGTTMPAILTEISFVSSPEDEHKLQNPAYRQQIAEALYKGIASYEQSAPHAKIAQLQRPSAR